MPNLPSPPPVEPLQEYYLLVEQPRSRLGHWTTVLRALDSPAAPPLAGVDAYHDERADQALLSLRYDALALGAEGRGFIEEIARLAEVPLVELSALGEHDRRRFVCERISRCDLHAGDLRGVVAALTELVRLIRGARAAACSSAAEAAANGPDATAGTPLARLQPGPAATGHPAPPPLPLPPPPIHAAAPRASSPAPGLVGPPPPPAARALPRMPSAGDAAYPTPASRTPTGPQGAVPARAPTGPQGAVPARAPTGPQGAVPARAPTGPTTPVAARTSTGPTGPTTPVAARTSTGPTGPATPVAARTSTGPTGPATPVAARTSTGPTTPPAPPASPRPGRPTVPASPVAARTPTGPRDALLGLPVDGADGAAPALGARFLFGGRWLPARVGAMSLRGAMLISGAVARAGEHVHVAVSFAEQRALVRGVVQRVSTSAEEQATGASTFEVRFELDDATRRQLAGALSAARAAGVTIKPPPPRAARRLPVEWAMSIATPRASMSCVALDVSADGLFLRGLPPLPVGVAVDFSTLLDDRERPIAGRARVARRVDEDEAARRGLAAGHGLQIVEMGDEDRLRWLGFLARVERRAGRRVLIGAAPGRLLELQHGLAAAGYGVSGGTDAGAVVELASGAGRVVDAAILDGGWADDGAPWLAALLDARQVPCVTMHGDPRRARAMLDRMLQVA